MRGTCLSWADLKPRQLHVLNPQQLCRIFISVLYCTVRIAMVCEGRTGQDYFTHRHFDKWGAARHEIATDIQGIIWQPVMFFFATIFQVNIHIQLVFICLSVQIQGVSRPLWHHLSWEWGTPMMAISPYIFWGRVCLLFVPKHKIVRIIGWWISLVYGYFLAFIYCISCKNQKK